MNKLIIIGASIAGILGTMDIITTDPLKYGACALLGITALMTLNELNPPQKQATKQQYQKPKTEEPKNIWDMFPKEAGTKEEVKSSSKAAMPTEGEIKEVFGKSKVHAHKKHHITFLILLGVLLLTVGSYIAFEEELITFTGNIIGTNDSIMEGFKEYFVEEVDITDKTRFGIGLDEIYIDLYQEEEALIASLNGECDSQKTTLESEVRAEEQQQCDFEKEDLESEITSLNSEIGNLCECSAEE